MPGVRDRVVRLRLKDQEGGLNLNMPKDLIDTIAARGGAAGEALLNRFAQPSGPPDADARTWPGWDGQRWVRLDVLVRTLADKSLGLTRALGTDVAHATPYSTLLSHARSVAPPGHDTPLTREQTDALQKLIDALAAISREFDTHAAGYENVPTPNPDLRVRPSL
jgi:hypothetical protein